MSKTTKPLKRKNPGMEFVAHRQTILVERGKKQLQPKKIGARLGGVHRMEKILGPILYKCSSETHLN